MSATAENLPVAPDSTPVAAPAAPTTALQAIEKAHQAASDSSPDAIDPTESDSIEATPASVGDPNSAATSALAADGKLPRESRVPLSRHEAAVRNARQQVEEELGWARQYGTKEQVANAWRRSQMLDNDPRGFIRMLADELGYDVSERKPPVAEKPAELIDPEPDLRAEDGTLAYSHKANQILVRNAIERAKAELLEKVSPALQYAEQGRQQAAQAEIRAQAQDFAQRALAEVSKMPHFNREGVLKAYQALTPEQRNDMGSYGSLLTAYTRYLHDVALPALAKSGEQRTIEDLRRSAVAGSTTAAATAPPASSKKTIRDGDLNALAAHMADLDSRRVAN